MVVSCYIIYSISISYLPRDSTSGLRLLKECHKQNLTWKTIDKMWTSHPTKQFKGIKNMPQLLGFYYPSGKRTCHHRKSPNLSWEIPSKMVHVHAFSMPAMFVYVRSKFSSDRHVV